MELDPPHSIEVITVTTTSNPGSSGRSVIPLQIELEKFPTQQEIEGHDNKMRRPVRPIDRQRMRPWLMELLDLNNVFGLRWTNRHQGIFQISWRHASRLGWNLETDGDVFERWARHTGIYKEGDPPEPKRWKANFRCALHSLNDVVELTNAVERRGRNACRTYRFLQSGDDQVLGRKRAKAKKAREAKLSAYERSLREPVRQVVVESASSEELLSEGEAEETTQDKVIVQKVDTKCEIAGEEYGLHHDHDYSAGPDKTVSEKTIVVRQGVGSIVLQKEIVSAPEPDNSTKNLFISNLDQLASAAMSSAGLEAGTVHEVEVSSSNRKVRQQKARKHRVESEDLSKKSDFSLKRLLTGGKGREEGQGSEHGPVTRKRKASTSFEMNSEERSEQFQVRAAKNRRRKLSEPTSPAKSSRSEAVKASGLSPPSPRMTRQRSERSSSPKIRGRKTRRGKKEEDEKSESTEPLMSSCLLLLEAATRLDNAEKGSNSSLRSSGSGETNISLSNMEVCEESVVETTVESEVPLSDHNVAQEVDITDIKLEPTEVEKSGDETKDETDDAGLTEAPHSSSPGILRSTLETIGTELKADDMRPRTRSGKSFLDSYSMSVSEGKIVVVKDSEAKGLFSGSSIQSEPNVSSEYKRRGRGRGRGRSSRGKYFVDIRTNSGPALTLMNNGDERNPDEVTMESVTTDGDVGKTEYLEEMEVPQVANFATVKSNSGVQQTVIQRALPVLSAPVQKSGSSATEFSAPVVIAHKVSGLAGTPQILMTSTAVNPQPSGRPVVASQKLVAAVANKTQSTLLPAQLLSKGLKNQSLMPGSTLPSVTKLAGSQTVGSVLPVALGSSMHVTSAPSPTSPIIANISAVSMSPGSGENPQLLSLPSSSISSLMNIKAAATVGPRTIILTRPPKTSVVTTSAAVTTTATAAAQKKEVATLEQGKEVQNEVKLHVLPVKPTTQLPNHSHPSVQAENALISQLQAHVTSAIQRESENPAQGVSGQTTPTQAVNVTAQIIFDPIKGPMLKFPIGPPLPLHSSIFQPQNFASQAQATSRTATGGADSTVVSSPALNSSTTLVNCADRKPTVPVVLGTKVFVDNPSSPPNSEAGSSSSSTATPTSVSLLRSQVETSKNSTVESKPDAVTTLSITKSAPISSSGESHVQQGTVSILPFGKMTSKFYPLKALQNPVSLLHKHQQGAAGANSSIVMDFQQALLAHRLAMPDGSEATVAETVLSAGSYSSVCQEDSGEVKPLAELCKSLLAQFFKSLDNQTSESEASGSSFSSPCVDVKQDPAVVQKQQESQQEPVLSDLKGVNCTESAQVSRLGSTVASNLKEEVELTLTDNNECIMASSSAIAGPADSEACSQQDSVMTEVGDEESKRIKYDSNIVMDPTAPLSLGEVPLFASGKGDSDSMSPTSDGGT
ncbi:uncharacterized protein LOC101850966 [Aplysia californica]|uniref:Uncharacterized protein LOC101850966 n=1 Tax=Aplysia californica TaxID=6500 RepID=A0ABM0JU90_APLCA|nr:uncharacterized protein LOC101850966 [Aplysia californica]